MRTKLLFFSFWTIICFSTTFQLWSIFRAKSYFYPIICGSGSHFCSKLSKWVMNANKLLFFAFWTIKWISTKSQLRSIFCSKSYSYPIICGCGSDFGGKFSKLVINANKTCFLRILNSNPIFKKKSTLIHFPRKILLLPHNLWKWTSFFFEVVQMSYKWEQNFFSSLFEL